MKNALVLAGCMLLAGIALTGCKTSEENYRKAYERATAKNDRNVTEFENTIYNRYRGQVRDVAVDLDGRTVNTKVIRVKVTPDGGGIREWLKKYSVVVGEFKQLFNARSMQTRFVDAGYPRAFLVENGEPYYYIVIDSSNDLAAMEVLADSLRQSSPIPLKDDFPYILQTP